MVGEKSNTIDKSPQGDMLVVELLSEKKINGMELEEREQTLQDTNQRIAEYHARLKELDEEIAKLKQEEGIALSDTELSEQLQKNAEAEKKSNNEQLDSLLNEEDKNLVAKEAAQTQYNDPARKYLIGEAKKEGQKKKYNLNLKQVIAKIKTGIKVLVAAGVLFVSTGFSVSEDGGMTYSTNTLVDRWTSLFPDNEEQYAKRWFEKQGLYEEKGTNMAITEETPAPKIEETKEIHRPDEFFQVIGAVPDPIADESQRDSFMSYRSQWINDEGFRYIPTPNRGNRKGDNIRYAGVVGVGHFLLDADLTTNYMHPNNVSYLQSAKEKGDWIPAFTKNPDGSVNLKYKKPNELSNQDIVISPLRQYKFDNVDWNSVMDDPSYKKSASLATKDGHLTNFLFSIDNGGKDVISRQSGLSVVFIWQDEYGNRIVRDFAGSVNQIRHEGEAILAKYKIAGTDLTIGYFDAGSFVSKPKAKSGTIETRQWEGFNPNLITGSALLIPADEIKYAQKQ